MSNQVLVTGGSGYLAGWVVGELLRRGGSVRTTVRSKKKEPEIRRVLAAMDGVGDVGDRLGMVEANLLHDAGWDRAVDGVSHIVHVASPMQVGEFAHQDVIRPAREGTSRILRAAQRHEVTRVVLTSSLEAARPADPAGVGDEHTWTDLNVTGTSDYTRAKTLAEQDAWAFSRAEDTPELATVLPGLMQGPVLGSHISGSVEMARRMVAGEMPRVPRLGFPIVDVRDVATLHVDLLTAPGGAGRRWLASGEFLWLSDIAAILREEFPELRDRLPRGDLPNIAMRAAALVKSDLRPMVPNLGRRTRFDDAITLRDLGWQTRPARETLVDAVRTLVT